MLQPRISGLVLVIFFVFYATGEDSIESSPRRRRQDADDVTTVLLVDNQGRSTFGRFLSVKPDLGLLTSTARTFIQEGVTTQYATQVLGTTLDNGRLYAHLLTKSSKVLYDSDLPTRSYNEFTNKKWNLDNNDLKSKNFVKNTDFISPNKAEPYLVFPTAKPLYRFVPKENDVQKENQSKKEEESSEEELLKSAPSNNARVPYDDGAKESVSQSFSGWNGKNEQSNIKVFQISPKHHDMNIENIINYKELNEDSTSSSKKKLREGDVGDLEPSKVRERDSLPTFTVRNEFSPSGLSYLGDFPDFDINTERTKATTAAERKAKLFFRPGKPSAQDLKKLPTVTYSGFADFTTVVGDTVIIFAPYTSETPRYSYGKATSISGEATVQQSTSTATPLRIPPFKFRPSTTAKIVLPSLRPSSPSESSIPSITPTTIATSRTPPPPVKPTIRLPNLSIKPSFTVKRPTKTKSYTTQDFDLENDSMHTVIIDATDRHRDTSTEQVEQHEDMAAKSAVLAAEQKLFEQSPTPQIDPPLIATSDDISTVVFAPEVIEPSESQTPMLSTPSEEDIAKIFASLQAAQNKQATEPLETRSTSIETSSTSVLSSSAEDNKPSAGGATTIFFDDDPFAIKNTAVVEQSTSSKVEDITTTTTTESHEEIEEEEEEEEEETTTQKEKTTTSTTAATTTTTTTTKRIETTTPKEQTSTTPKEEETTTQKQITTTPKEQEATNEIQTDDENIPSTLNIPETTPQIDSNEVDTEKTEEEEDDEIKTDVVCTEGAQIIPTTSYKTLTYLTTFFIPIEDTTTTSVKSNEVVSTEIGFQTLPCDTQQQITPTAVTDPTTSQPTAITTTPEQQTTTLINEETTTNARELEGTTEHITTFDTTTLTVPYETTPLEITTERRHVTESEPETTEMTTENGEEIEVLFKTLYTTYTYLTTFFQESTSSVVSRKEVITNVITSTLEPGSEATDPAVAGLFAREDSLVSGYKSKPPTFDDIPDIAPTSVGGGRATITYPLSEEDIRENILDHDVTKATPALNNEQLLQTANGIKTYYTTYTYFTTIFVDGESTISSRTEVYTNYVTPSIQPTAAFENILPTGLPELLLSSEGSKDQVESPNTEYEGEEEDDEEEGTTEDEDEEEEEEEEEEVTSRLKNLNVTPAIAYNTTINRQRSSATTENSLLDSTTTFVSETERTGNDIDITTKNVGLSYTTLNRGGGSSESSAVIESNLLLNLSDYETISTMVTDVRSSTSTGESRIIDNVDKRNVLDDQIVAETNNDSEILPSPTLLLQTSYTTFTYFTTMYQGTTSSNVVSRLETVTNVVTETLTPTHTLSAEDMNLPITYFTTFTYWTTLYKEGVTKVTSREETISNVVTPSAVATTDPPTINITPIVPTSTAEISSSSTEAVSETTIQPTKTVDKDELTTYYTTYTYYTTSYIGNSTVLNSRLETVVNVVNETATADPEVEKLIARAIETGNNANQLDSGDSKSISPDKTAPLPTGLLSTIVSTIDNSGTKTILSTDIYGTYIDGYYAKVLESATSVITETPVIKEPVRPTGVVSLNQGKIVDAEGISTLYYTTKAIGTFIDNLYAQVIESTSSLKVDEERKSALVIDQPVGHKTGLVRLIEGSMVQNHTTTLYQSKVIGTVIEGRYAQIIESTSSFIIEKTQAPSISPSLSSGIAPTATQGPDQQISATATPISPSPVVIEGSLSDSTKVDDENVTESDETEEGGEEQEEEEEEEEGAKVGENGKKKSRLTFPSRTRTFTPVIRPFASRGRPTFAPKRKGLGPSGATTITRSDFTPTVTAVPASKSGNRFGNRKSASQSSGAVVHPTASGSRRFIRPKSSSAPSNNVIASSSFVPRGKSSARISPTASGSRKSSGRTSSQLRSSSLYSGNTRFGRIRPTAASTLPRPSSRGVTPPTSEVNDDENDLTTQLTESPTDFTDDDHDTTIPLATTTESGRRNPLLKLRRPPLSRPNPTARAPIAKAAGKSNKKATGNKATTTTAKPKTTRPLTALQNRPRPGNGLFPRRGLFTTTTTPSPEDEEEEEEDDFEGEEEDDDTDYDGSNTDTQTEKAPTLAPSTRKGRANNIVSVRPFKFRPRSKRETNFSRFRRPTGRSTAAPKEQEPETEAPKPAKQGRYKPRGRTGSSSSSASSTTQKSQPAKRLSPTRASSNQGRSQFTLREKDKSSNSRPSNFRRGSSQKPQTSARRPSTTISSRPKAPKLRVQHTTAEAPSRRKPASSAETSSRGTVNRNSRQRTNSFTRTRGTSAEQIDNFVLPNFNDGTITITHAIPIDITIPVVNGKVTEYRNVISAKYSTEVLIPQQYSTAVNSAGKIFTILRSDSTNVGVDGATEITRFVLNETPTTTVIFTPTYIRGHKTSWSHILPSTVYAVEQVVSTIKPKLSAQAPLANILLSQLLLGNPGIQANPLLGLQNPAVPATPTTEFKTRTTTYVTTVTSATSTVIPITFRGKEIFTTIIDSSVNVVTATEFVTDTIVATPTVGIGGAGLNSLLLPLLLQQQQQPAQIQQPSGLFGGLGQEQQQQPLFSDVPDKYDFLSFEDAGSVSESEEFTEQNLSDDVTRPPRRKSHRKKPKNKNITPAPPAKETSVITLYVSGKTPGEFSTILSTVIVDKEGQRKKRNVEVDVQPSRILREEASTRYSYIDTYIAPAVSEEDLGNSGTTVETQSLESILGDVGKYIVTQTPELFAVKPTKTNKLKKYTSVKYVRAKEKPESLEESSSFLA